MTGLMPLVLLHLGDTVTRFPNEAAAKKDGAKLHTAENPARIEITPDGGGRIVSLIFNAQHSTWDTDRHD